MIGIVGLAGAGKDTVCDILIENHFKDHIRYAFADPLKSFTMSTLHLTQQQCYDNKLKEENVSMRINKQFLFETFKSTMTNMFPKIRQDSHVYLFETFLRVISTETKKDFFLVRKYFEYALLGEYIHFDTTPRKLLQIIGTEFFRNTISSNFWTDIAPKSHIIVPDVRFQNEIDFIKNNGGVIIKVVDKGLKEIQTSGHASEDLARTFNKQDYTVENDKTAGMSNLNFKVSAVAFGIKNGSR